MRKFINEDTSTFILIIAIAIFIAILFSDLQCSIQITQSPTEIT